MHRAILHFLISAKKEFGFEFETHAIMFPTHVYKSNEVHRLDSYWKARGIHINWHPITVKVKRLFETAQKNGTNPCYFCHSVKRKYSFQYLNHTTTDWNSLGIIIGWSLWDIVGYSLGIFIRQCLYRQRRHFTRVNPLKKDFIRASQRFYPVLKMKEGYTIYKPLLRYNDQDIIKIVRENEIPILTTDCKYRDFRPKRFYAECYKKMDLYFNYDKVIKFAQEALHLEKPISYTSLDKEAFISSIF